MSSTVNAGIADLATRADCCVVVMVFLAACIARDFVHRVMPLLRCHASLRPRSNPSLSGGRMFRKQMMAAAVALIAAVTAGSAATIAAPPDACKDLPSHTALREALAAARGQANGGFNLDMW